MPLQVTLFAQMYITCFASIDSFFYLYLQTICVQHMYGHALNSCAGSDGLQFLEEHLVLCKLVLYVMSGCG